MTTRLITVNDVYAFDPNIVVGIDDFEDVIGRHFRQPEGGHGFDPGCPYVAHDDITVQFSLNGRALVNLWCRGDRLAEGGHRFVQRLTALRHKYPILRRNRFLTGV
jgi:hypothetical protein